MWPAGLKEAAQCNCGRICKSIFIDWVCQLSLVQLCLVRLIRCEASLKDTWAVFFHSKISFCFVCLWQVFWILTRIKKKGEESEHTEKKKSEIVWCVIPWSEVWHSGAFLIIKLLQSKNNKQMRFDMRRNSRASVRACMTMDLMRKNNLQRTLSRALIWAHLIASPVIKKCFSPDRVIYSQMAG